MNNAEKVKCKVLNARMSNIDFLIKKDKNEYKEPNVQNPEKIEEEDENWLSHENENWLLNFTKWT